MTDGGWQAEHKQSRYDSYRHSLANEDSSAQTNWIKKRDLHIIKKKINHISGPWQPRTGCARHFQPVRGHRRNANLVNLGHSLAKVGGKNGIPAPAPPPVVEEHLFEEERTGKTRHDTPNIMEQQKIKWECFVEADGLSGSGSVG